MWWLGSFPCAYCPIRPEISTKSALDVGFTTNKESNEEAKFFSLPNRLIKPFISCGTKKRYCQAVASVQPRPTSCGSKGVSHTPFFSRRLKKPSSPSKTFL